MEKGDIDMNFAQRAEVGVAPALRVADNQAAERPAAGGGEIEALVSTTFVCVSFGATLLIPAVTMEPRKKDVAMTAIGRSFFMIKECVEQKSTSGRPELHAQDQSSEPECSPAPAFLLHGNFACHIHMAALV
ncbi:MAG: hypothetical protein EXS38_03215 [Opitutus sp.]|nr:hypothetical protein [Opitutus sp.]